MKLRAKQRNLSTWRDVFFRERVLDIESTCLIREELEKVRAMFISVVLPAFNAEQYLREAVESVLPQSHREFELLVVDDGSEDASLVDTWRFEGEVDRAGLPEPSREEYLAIRREMPVFQRLNELRQHAGYALYRRGILAYSVRHYASMTLWLGLATLLGSRHIFRQLSERAIKPALRRSGLADSSPSPEPVIAVAVQARGKPNAR